MSTENEAWRNSSSAAENNGADRDVNQQNNESGYTRPSYNRENGERPRRPRFNPNAENAAYRSQRVYNNGERPYRPRFNPNAVGGDNQRAYGNDRPYRPRFNGEEGERPQRPYGNAAGGNRPYRPQPRYNNNGERPYGNERPYRPRFNAEDGNRAPRPYNNDRPAYGNADHSLRPRYNSYNNEGDGNRMQRPYAPGRPRFNQQGGNRPYGNNGRNQQRNNGYDPNAKYSKKKRIEYKEQFVDPNEPIRLNKYLANAGICSRREADEFITAGVVSVNGQVVTELGTKIKRSDEVKFHDQVVNIERKVYVLLNKPKDTVTTSDDPQERRTVMDLVKGACEERIYPVGRLDRNTTGVLLLTNDGDLASKLTHPQYLKKKIYHVHLDKDLTRADMEKIASGIQLDDGEIHADAISYTDEEKKNDIGIEIHSGKNRIVRRIFEALGYKVMKLDRVYFAGLTKKGLRRGDWRYLTEQEVNFLRMGSFE